METVWFCLVALLLAMYVVLDGFDLGAGVAHLLVARTEPERRAVLASIGPVWDGNEVFLLAGGGTLYFAFPALYASSFSGFYLPLMVVLWLLILRGIAVEFRNHLTGAVWRPLWDAVFAGSSGLLAIFFGAALGNVVRGVPLDRAGEFFLPLWTDFGAGGVSVHDVGILDWYTILIALAALLTLTVHGCLWIVLKTEGAVEDRARALAARLWWGLGAAVLAVTAASFAVQPHLAGQFSAHPWGAVFPLTAVAGLSGMRLLRGRRAGLDSFLSSCLFIIGMLTSAAFGLYPFVLPSNTDAALSLTVLNSAAPAYGLEIGLVWFIPGMLLTAGYFTYTYRSFAGKVRV
jgi:cytochrome d ubiquinol oxidase subunit II